MNEIRRISGKHQGGEYSDSWENKCKGPGVGVHSAWSHVGGTREATDAGEE